MNFQERRTFGMESVTLAAVQQSQYDVRIQEFLCSTARSGFQVLGWVLA